MKLTPRQEATVLAALRNWQSKLNPDEFIDSNLSAIATADGTLIALDSQEIDHLCKTLESCTACQSGFPTDGPIPGTLANGERCDACERFPSDEAARLAVAHSIPITMQNILIPAALWASTLDQLEAVLDYPDHGIGCETEREARELLGKGRSIKAIDARVILSRAIDLITDSIDGRMDDEPDIAKANELLCELYQHFGPPSICQHCGRDFSADPSAMQHGCPSDDCPSHDPGEGRTPPLHELRIMLNAAAYWADAEADEDHPDPLSEVCDLARDANELFNTIFPETPSQPIDIHAALANYDPAAEPSPWYRNHYKCPCGNEWQDEWECMCNDKCCVCGKEIEPHQSDDLTEP